MKRLVIIKLGGSAVTRKEKKYTLAPKNQLKRIFKEIKTYPGKLVVICGGGSFGHHAVLDKGLNDAKGAAYVRRQMHILRIKLAKYFLSYDLPVHVFSPYSIGITKKGDTFEGPLRKKISSILKNEEVPFTSGDVVKEKNGSYVVLSGDDQAVYLANALAVERIIMVLNEKSKGVHPNYPIKKYPPIRKLTGEKWENVKQNYRDYDKEQDTPDVTGGLFGKVDLLFRVNPETEAILVGSREKGAVSKTLKKGITPIKKREIQGTYIPKDQRISKSVKFNREPPTG